jgi:hypothetical protein
MKTDKILNITLNFLKIALMSVGIILTIIILSGGEPDPQSKEAIPAMGAIGFSLKFSYFLLAACVAAWVIFSLVHMVTNPKASVKSLIGIAFFALMIIIAWSMSSEELLPRWVLENNASVEKGGPVLYTGADSKFADLSMITTYIFGLLVFVAIIGGEVYSLLKRLGK